MGERTAKEWGRVAVSLPGWRWMRGAVDTTGRTFIEYADCGEAQWLWVADDGCEHLPVDGRLPDPDDPATAGCLMALLGCGLGCAVNADGWWSVGSWPTVHGEGPTMGRACIAAAEALGRWPGGAP